MPYKDKDAKNEYQRKWERQNREDWIESKGGCCIECGSRDDLEVDHIDRRIKLTHRVWCWSVERRELELQKCQVLCHTCHVDKTCEDLGLIRRAHGNVAMYQYGCRCSICCVAKTSYTKSLRNR